MPIDEEKELDLENEEGTEEEGGSSKPKPKLTPEQIQGIKKRDFTRLAKELGIELPKPESEKPTKKDNGFDYGKLAFLEAKGISHQEDQKWLEERVNESGIELRELVSKDWVTKELKERGKARKVEDSIPDGTKRSPGGFGEDSVEYYVASGKQPPAEKGLEFRKKVLNARLKKDEDGSKFSKDSLISPFKQ